jgi:FkbM family methyltransferase
MFKNQFNSTISRILILFVRGTISSNKCPLFIKKLAFDFFEGILSSSTIIETSEKKVLFSTPNRLSYYRATTLVSKEPATIEWINTFSSEDIFWDIGANVGSYSIYASVVTGCTTYSFEPLPHNLLLLCNNVALNNLANRITIVPLALGGGAPLSIPSSSFNLAGANLYKNRSTEVPSVPFISLNMTSVRFLLNSGSLHLPTKIKIDVDGPEMEILFCVRPFLSTVSSILIELDTITNSQSAFDFLSNEGFCLASSHHLESTLYNYTFTRT